MPDAAIAYLNMARADLRRLLERQRAFSLADAEAATLTAIEDTRRAIAQFDRSEAAVWSDRPGQT
jgi:hypothetical protein